MFILVLSAIAYKDQKSQTIKNEMVLLVLGLALVHNITGDFVQNVIGMLSVSIPMLFITIIKPESFGGGDIKLMAAGGLYLGNDKIISAMIIAVVTAALYCIFLLFSKKASWEKTFPFGPFLCTGMICALLFL